MSEPNGQLKFTFSQLIQVVTLLVAGVLAWASLRSELREMRISTEYRLANVEARLSHIEAARHR